jgi:hypothetical protein
MSYNINKTDGNVVAVITDGQTNSTSTSLTLVGQSYIGYGEILQENLVAIMENFAKANAPAHPITGQLWFDSHNNILNVYTSGSTWKKISYSTVSNDPPANPSVGDFWFNSIKDQLLVWAGTSWTLVGPHHTRTQGPTGANAVSIIDTLSNTHKVVSIESGGSVFALFNPDPEFTPNVAITGFGTVKTGFNINSSLVGTTYNGTAQNAITLNGISSTTFLRNDQNSAINGNLFVNSNNGLWVGNTGSFRVTLDDVTQSVTLRSYTNNANINIVGTRNNTPVYFIQSDITTGLLTVADNPTAALGIATKQYVDNSITTTSGVITSSIVSNVLAINTTLGVLTSEINSVNIYAQNLNSIKANLNSPALTGTPTAPTATESTNTTQVATTEFVTIAVGTLSSATFANTGAIVNSLNTYARISSPTFTDFPRAPTMAAGNASTILATTQFVSTAVVSKAPLNAPVFTGVPLAPTAATGTNTTQLATTAFVNASISASGLPLPAGMIVMWSGSVGTIPSGWLLCNGSNGTPDLRNRFVIGAGLTYPVAATGGSKDAVVVAHTHIVGDPGHSHQMTRVLTDLNVDARFDALSQFAVADDAEYTDRNTDSATTGITIATAGVSGTNANLPPYYALCYIMKAA